MRDTNCVNQVVYHKHIDVEHDPLTGPMLVLKRKHTTDAHRKHDYLTVSPFPKSGGCQSESVKRDELMHAIKDFDTVLQFHNARAQHAYAKLHAIEHKHASFYRHMSAREQASTLFRTIDSDSNGYITDDELQTLLASEKSNRVNTLFKLFNFASENGENLSASEDVELLPDLLQKQESELTLDDYKRVFGIKPHPNMETFGKDVHEELQLLEILSRSGEMTQKEKELVFGRLSNGKLRETVVRRLDMNKLKKMVNDDTSVRPDDMRALEVECKAAARVAIAAKLSILNDQEKKELAKRAQAKKQA